MNIKRGLSWKLCKRRKRKNGGVRTGEDKEERKEEEGAREEEEGEGKGTKEPPPSQSAIAAAGWEYFLHLCSCRLPQLARSTANLGLASSEDSIVLLAT